MADEAPKGPVKAAEGLLQPSELLTDPHGFPIDLTRAIIRNPDGSYSTERTMTVGIGDRIYNIPTIWDGQEVQPMIAIKNAQEQLRQGGIFPNFDNYNEAIYAAQERSSFLGKIGKLRGFF